MERKGQRELLGAAFPRFVMGGARSRASGPSGGSGCSEPSIRGCLWGAGGSPAPRVLNQAPKVPAWKHLSPLPDPLFSGTEGQVCSHPLSAPAPLRPLTVGSTTSQCMQVCREGPRAKSTGEAGWGRARAGSGAASHLALPSLFGLVSVCLLLHSSLVPEALLL